MQSSPPERPANGRVFLSNTRVLPERHGTNATSLEVTVHPLSQIAPAVRPQKRLFEPGLLDVAPLAHLRQKNERDAQLLARLQVSPPVADHDRAGSRQCMARQDAL